MEFSPGGKSNLVRSAAKDLQAAASKLDKAEYGNFALRIEHMEVEILRLIVDNKIEDFEDASNEHE